MTRPIYYRAELTRADLTQADLTQGRVDPSSWRESIINELGQYLARTGRLFSRVADEDIPQ